MSLEQLSNLAQILGTLGIIVSLIFVGLQIRQNVGFVPAFVTDVDAVLAKDSGRRVI